MAKYKTLLIGCGAASGSLEPRGTHVKLTHLPALERHPRFRLEAAVDPDARRLRTLARRWDISRASARLEDWLGESWDLAIVASPTPLHARQIRTLLDADVRFILAEKPMTESAAETKQLLALAHRRGIGLMVHYPRRYAPVLHALRRELRAILGEPITTHAYYGKGFRHLAVHSLDLLHHWFGPYETVLAIENRLAPHEPDSPLVQLSGGSAPTAVFQPYRYRHYPLADLDVLGNKGRIRIVDLADRFEIYAARKSKTHSGYNELKLASRRSTGFLQATARLLDRIASALDAGRPAWDDAEIYLARVADAAEKSLRRKVACRI